MIKNAFLAIPALLLASCTSTDTQVESANAAWPAPVTAPSGADMEPLAGFEMSEALCAGCHAVAPGQISPNPSAPSFMMVANMPGLTNTTLKAFLLDSHSFPQEMNVEVSDEDAQLLTDYIITLREEGYAAPGQ
ncbi:hypothetical protein [Pontixanthobacter luteolus]|uniref:hypothetical protein n=1 Tax=Pontixanthobacter luteolus TaxID=295089 RepID=UPI002303DFDA|nr:hypothetical protein [Pontixanthobacter luteolus]